MEARERNAKKLFNHKLREGCGFNRAMAYKYKDLIRTGALDDYNHVSNELEYQLYTLGQFMEVEEYRETETSNKEILTILKELI